MMIIGNKVKLKYLMCVVNEYNEFKGFVSYRAKKNDSTKKINTILKSKAESLGLKTAGVRFAT